MTTSGSTTTLTKYESVPGVCSVVIVGSGPSESISYVVTDGLGSVSEALDGNGNVTAQQLYGPYGGMRYSSGTMPTAKGYTGQYADAASSGLDYYNARYYDPLVGQFTSADTVDQGGLNRYAYVADDPETNTDPTGQACTPMDGPMGAQCGVGSGGGGCKTNCGGGCKSNCGGGCKTNCGGGCKSNCGGGGTPCDAACLAKGQEGLTFLQDLLGSTWGTVVIPQDIADLLLQGPRFLTSLLALLGGDWLALVGVVDAGTHMVRDILDMMNFATKLLGDLNIRSAAIGALTGVVRVWSTFLDFLTPFVDIASELGGLFFNPLGAVMSQLRDVLLPSLDTYLQSDMMGSFIPWLVGQAFGGNAAWLGNGAVNLLAAMTPQDFCSLPVAGTWCRS